MLQIGHFFVYTTNIFLGCFLYKFQSYIHFKWTVDAISNDSPFIETIDNGENIIDGYNANKVISEVYASFVLQCTVSGL